MVISSKKRVYQNINHEMVLLYWNIGRIIIDIQDGKKHAKYDDRTLEKLSAKLTEEFGKGFSTRNLRRMRKFYSIFPKWTTVLSKLSWAHYLEVIKVDDVNARNFYIKETINSNWSVRELKRQISSLLYEGLCISKDATEIMELATNGQNIKTSKDLIKDPFVLEFLELKEIKTIGILLCTNKNETVVKYSLPLDNDQIYASKYKLSFPSDEDFINEIEKEKQNYYMDK